jgi:dihydropyrimidinase
MNLDVVVRSGSVATATSTVITDIGISDGRIAAFGSGLDAPEVIEAVGMTVVPGAVDVHTHFGNEVGGVPTLDDYESGSRAAALGGVTSFINFAFQVPGQTLVAAVVDERNKALAESHLDFGLHVVVTDPSTVDLTRELPELVELGVTSLKVFMAGAGLGLSRDHLITVLGAAAEAGLLVNVHAEDGPLVDHLTRRLLANGQRAPKYLPLARPPEAEALAISLVAGYAKLLGCPVYIVHVSCRAALEAIRQARLGGAEVYVETRPAYLYLNSDRYEVEGSRANEYVCWPPLRQPDDQAALWDGIRSGEIQTYATDHATWGSDQKAEVSTGFHDVAPGMSSIQTSIGLLYAEGVSRNRLSLSRFVELTATNPAKLFGLWPRKGSLALGSDADLVILDPKRTVRIAATQMASKTDFDPFDGWRMTGWPILSMVRGKVIMKDGRMIDEHRRGTFQLRGRAQPL